MAGFRRPHRDFKVHQKYWDLYPDESKIAIAKHDRRDASQPEIAFHQVHVQRVGLCCRMREARSSRLSPCAGWDDVCQRH